MTGPPRSHVSTWNIVRWVLVLPVAFGAYVLLTTVLIAVADRLPLVVSGSAGYPTTVIFTVSILTAVSVGTLAAPRRRFQVACALALLVAVMLACVAVGAALQKEWEPALLPVILGQMAGAFVAALLFWRGRKENE